MLNFDFFYSSILSHLNKDSFFFVSLFLFSLLIQSTLHFITLDKQIDINNIFMFLRTVFFSFVFCTNSLSGVSLSSTSKMNSKPKLSLSYSRYLVGRFIVVIKIDTHTQNRSIFFFLFLTRKKTQTSHDFFLFLNLNYRARRAVSWGSGHTKKISYVTLFFSHPSFFCY